MSPWIGSIFRGLSSRLEDLYLRPDESSGGRFELKGMGFRRDQVGLVSGWGWRWHHWWMMLGRTEELETRMCFLFPWFFWLSFQYLDIFKLHKFKGMLQLLGLLLRFHTVNPHLCAWPCGATRATLTPPPATPHCLLVWMSSNSYPEAILFVDDHLKTDTLSSTDLSNLNNRIIN